MSTKNVQTPDDVRASVSSIYSELLKKRSVEKEQKAELKRLKEEEKKQQKEEKKEENSKNMSKKERRQAAVDSWKEIVIGLTGEDLEYSSEKKSKKKYKAWIDDDTSNTVTPTKTKKPKKKNYQKEFAPELSMLKSLVAEQNRFSADLLKRYQNAAGPNTKDAMPLNKTMVDLVAQINASRSNSLGFLNAISNAKKTIADLYMRQKKLDADLHGASGISDTDLALVGSDVAASMFSAIPPSQPQFSEHSYSQAPQQNQVQQPQDQTPVFQGASSTFDPNTWEGPEFDSSTESVVYESIPHHVIVEWHKDEDKARFKAVRNDNGEELVGAPVPTVDPSTLSFNEKDMRVKGQFDEIYPLVIV